MERIAILFRCKSGARPNPVKGFYTALAMFLPLLVLTMFGQSEFAGLVLTGALLISFGDISTSPRTQAWVLGMTTIGGTLMTALGRLIGGPWWIEIVEIFLVVSISGLLSAYGQVAAVMGLLLTIPFVSSLASRGGPATTLPAAGGFFLGGAILMLFALFFTWIPSHQNIPIYWAALTVIICTLQNQKASLKKAFQNVVATYLGALLAEVVITSVQNTWAFGLIVVAITFLAFTIKELNGLLYLLLFTTLLLLLISIGMSGQSLAVWRVVTILIGAGIVIVIAFLSQMPFFERNAVPSVKGSNRTSAKNDGYTAQ